MRIAMLESFRTTIATLAGRVAATRRHAEFTCSDCARWQQCGLPPSDDCLIRIEQMSQEDRDLQRRVDAFRPW